MIPLSFVSCLSEKQTQRYLIRDEPLKYHISLQCPALGAKLTHYKSTTRLFSHVCAFFNETLIDNNNIK